MDTSGNITIYESQNVVGQGFTLSENQNFTASATSIGLPNDTVITYKVQPAGGPTGASGPAILHGAPSNSTLVVNTNFTITVFAFDNTGTPITTGAYSTVPVTVALNPTTATLSGPLTQSLVAGTTTFNNMQINETGTYYLIFTSPGFEYAASFVFTVIT